MKGCTRISPRWSNYLYINSCINSVDTIKYSVVSIQSRKGNQVCISQVFLFVLQNWSGFALTSLSVQKLERQLLNAFNKNLLVFPHEQVKPKKSYSCGTNRPVRRRLEFKSTLNHSFTRFLSSVESSSKGE